MVGRVTEEEIEAARTRAGGFTRATLAQWGVPWPPPKGWKEDLIGHDDSLHGGEPIIDDIENDDPIRRIEAKLDLLLAMADKHENCLTVEQG